MSENIHQRALQLIARARVEGMPETDTAWLRAHLEGCDSCAAHARQTDRSLRSLRSVAIPLPDGLARRTQFRVRLRALELREREPKRRALWFACGVSWIFGGVSTPYVWSLFQWFGQRAGLPKVVWEVGFGLWWTIPALFAVAVLLMEKVRQGDEPAWMRQDS
jgi:hypothetical protein